MIFPEFHEIWIYLLGAWIIDQCFGEYPNHWHPVVWMGKLISWATGPYQSWNPTIQRAWGIVIAIFLPLTCATLTYFALAWLASWPLIEAALGIFLLKASFAVRALGQSALQVGNYLKQDRLEDARFALRSLCSRDARNLSKEELAEGSIASIAENLCDSYIAPLCFFLIFGVPGAIFYRCVNTMDAMIGYRDHRRWIGFASARLDDALNWIPARITALGLMMTSRLLGYPLQRTWTTTWRDHQKTPSPNGGWPMATMAGILGVQLRKPSCYTLGEALQPISPELIDQAWRIAWGTACGLTILGLVSRVGF